MKAYDIPGLSTNKDLDIVYEWARTVPENGVIVELGSFFGRTAVAFAEGAHPSVKIYCIDYFDDWKNPHTPDDAPGGDFWVLDKIYNKGDEFRKHTQEYKNIVPLKLNEDEMIYQYDKGPIDILFIDAMHQNPSDIRNLIFFKKFLKPNSLICGHDYYEDNRFPDVGINIKILEKMFNKTVTMYKWSSMWSIRIKE